MTGFADAFAVQGSQIPGRCVCEPADRTAAMRVAAALTLLACLGTAAAQPFLPGTAAPRSEWLVLSPVGAVMMRSGQQCPASNARLDSHLPDVGLQGL